jgi:putative transposase
MHSHLIVEAIELDYLKRDPKWTESLAVGSKDFVERFQEKLSSRSRRAEVIDSGGAHILREAVKPYGDVIPTKNIHLRE